MSSDTQLAKKVRMSVSIDKNEKGDMLHVTTLDNGCGLKDPITAFLQGPKKQTGPGLSLIELRQWLKDHGGFISVTAPADNTGTAIVFSLPGTLAN